jgi:aryl-alcohol dehydrogenase-like predicted oxidoreductase
MTFGTDWGWGASANESGKQFELFAEAGGTLIDTANKYTNGTAESILGELLAADREHFVVGTKYSLNVRDGDLNAGGNHRKSLVQALEASLRRLRTDYVDILWLHAWDYLTPPDEVMRALDDQVRLGKVLYLGISDTPAWVVAQMQTLAAGRGWSSFVGLQAEYSLVQREAERELTPMARSLGLGARTAQQLADNLNCVDVNLPADALARLDQASRITRGFPHDFLASADFIFGGLSGQLDLPPGRSAHG